MLGPDVGPQVFDGPGDLFDRVASQRATVLEEGARETRSVIYRIRVMVAVVTVVSAAVGSGIMALSRRGAGQPEPEGAAPPLCAATGTVPGPASDWPLTLPSAGGARSHDSHACANAAPGCA